MPTPVISGRKRPSSVAVATIAPIVLLALAAVTFFWPLLSGTRDVPGNLGDARFNIFVLEHVFRWLTGAEASLLSPGIFFPYPLTLAFSDMHFGTELFYAAFRVLGLDPYDAFKGWVALGYVLTFLAGYWVFLRMTGAPWLSAIGAFAFAFSLPSLAQLGHAQLTYRVGVPFACLFAARYAERKLPSDLYGLVAAISLQMLINVYLGFYALMIALAVFLAGLIVRQPRDLRAPFALLGSFVGNMRMRHNHPPRRVVLTIVLFVAALAMLSVHFYAGHLYKFGRSWSDIASMVPRPWSYLLMDRLDYWAPISRALPDVPVRGEHQLFLGLPVALGFLLVGAASILRPAWTSPGVRVQLLATLITLAVMTMFGPLTLYMFIAQLPGFSALRAATRFGLVGAFTVIATSVLFLAQTRMHGQWKTIVAAGFVAFMAFDLTQFALPSFSGSDARQRVAAITALVASSSLADRSVLAFVGDSADTPYIDQLDAMLAAQSLGIPTFNGYSGNFVPGHRLKSSCDGFKSQLQGYAGWAKRNGYPELADIDYEPLVIGTKTCDLLEVQNIPVIIDQPLTPEETAQHLSLANPLIARRGDMLTVTITLHNGAEKAVATQGTNPLRLAWRFPEDFQSVRAGWDSQPRVEVGSNLEPGETRNVSFDVPLNPNDQHRRLQVTFVEEYRFWAHDLGVMPFEIPLADP